MNTDRQQSAAGSPLWLASLPARLLCFSPVSQFEGGASLRAWETGPEEREGETKVTKRRRQTKGRKGNKHKSIHLKEAVGHDGAVLYPFLCIFFQSLLIAAPSSPSECFPALPPPHSNPTLAVLLGAVLKNECTPTVSVGTVGIWIGFVSIRLSNLKESATQKRMVVEVEMELGGGAGQDKSS